MTENDLGGLLENYVAIELFRRNPLFPLVGFKKSSSGTEIDFIFKLNGQAIPVEVKVVPQLKGMKAF